MYIIGAGAIGRALAVILQRHGRKVILVKASEAITAHTEQVTVLLPNGSLLAEEITVEPLQGIQYFKGIIAVTTKSYANEQVAAALKNKTGSAPIVILQNGLGVEAAFLQQGFTGLYRCVLFATSQYNAAGQVVFKPVTASLIGMVDEGNAETLDAVTALMNTPVFPFSSQRHIEKIVWKKTIANCVFNSVCPLIETDNGIFHRNAAALAIAQAMISECIAVAALEGIQLTAEEVTESLLLISQFSDGQLISTLQDIRNKRPTEIDTLNLAIASIAAARKQEHLVQITNTLGRLVKIKSLL